VFPAARDATPKVGVAEWRVRRIRLTKTRAGEIRQRAFERSNAALIANGPRSTDRDGHVSRCVFRK
jgi:hypothetical protein